MKAALEKNGFKGCKDSDLEPVFTYLEFCLKQVSRITSCPRKTALASHPIVRPRLNLGRYFQRTWLNGGRTTWRGVGTLS